MKTYAPDLIELCGQLQKVCDRVALSQNLPLGVFKQMAVNCDKTVPVAMRDLRIVIECYEQLWEITCEVNSAEFKGVCA